MNIYLLECCPLCGGKVSGSAVNMTSMHDWDESLWVENIVDARQDWQIEENKAITSVSARFSTCDNDKNHYFNIRPYGDYEEHYVTSEELEDKLSKSKEVYEAYLSLSQTIIEKEEEE